jgi:hypothetical protein
MSLTVGLHYRVCLFAARIVRGLDQSGSAASPFDQQTGLEDRPALRNV